MTPNLHRIKWGVRAVLAVTVAVSVGANILHAQPNAISRAFSGWAPLCLLAAIELVAKVPMSRKAATVARVCAMVAIAFIAAWVSYWQQVGVLRHYGETGHGSQYMLPLTIDGLIVIASVSLVEIAVRIRSVLEPPAAQVSGMSPRRPPGHVGSAQPAPIPAPKTAAQPTDDAAQESAPSAQARSVARPSLNMQARKVKDPRFPTVIDLYAQHGSAAKVAAAMNGNAPSLRTINNWVKATNKAGSDT